MSGSLCMQCQTQTTVFSNTCNSCFISHPKDKMLEEIKKYDNEWTDNDCLQYNNISQILTSTKVLLYKLQTLGFVPLLLLGKRRRGSKHIDMESFCPHPKVIEETGSIETLRNIYLGLLNVTLGKECQCSPLPPESEGTHADIEGTPIPAELHRIPISIRLNIIPTPTETGQPNTPTNPVGSPTTVIPPGTPAPSKQDGIPISIRLNIIPTPTDSGKPSTPTNPVGIPKQTNPVGTPTAVVPYETPAPTKLDGVPISICNIPIPVEQGKPSTPTNVVRTHTKIDSVETLAPTVVDGIPTSIGLNKLSSPIEPGKPSTSIYPTGTLSPKDPVGSPAPVEQDILPLSSDAGKNKLDEIPTYICLKGIPTSICLNGIPTPIHKKNSRPIQPKIPRPIQPKLHTPIPASKASPTTNSVESPVAINEIYDYSELQDQEMQRLKRKNWMEGDLIEVEDDDTSTQEHKKIKITGPTDVASGSTALSAYPHTPEPALLPTEAEEWLTLEMDSERPVMSRHAEVDTEVLDQLEKNNEEWQNLDMDSDTDIPSVSRHAEVDAKELDQLEKSSIVQATNKQTLWAINCFKDWLAEKRVLVDFSTIEKHEMNALLRDFYCSVRRGKGGEYCIPSYIGLRAGLNRFINLRPFSRAWCLMKDSEFSSSNKVFIGVLKKIRREGREKTTHPKVIKAQDLEILINSVVLSPYTPKGLVNKVWFDIQLHFGRRGKEGNRQLTPQSFVIKRDENGTKYAKMISKEDGKFYNGADGQNRRGIMLEKPGSHLCPVASLEKYLSKIPRDATAFFLHPKKMVITSDSIWYSQEPMGFNYLGSMLPRMCQEAGTSEKYTNHCFGPLREIMSVSGHKADSSVKGY